MRTFRMLSLAASLPGLPGLNGGKTYAAWPVWSGSFRDEVRFAPLPKKKALKLSPLKGRRKAPVEFVGIELSSGGDGMQPDPVCGYAVSYSNVPVGNELALPKRLRARLKDTPKMLPDASTVSGSSVFWMFTPLVL